MAARAKPAKASADKLAAYRAKRDFAQTSEPNDAGVAPGRRLIVQHHFATRDHFDLRLEIDGVLASWAVTRGPSANPRDKRLAVRTEDHPLDYSDFEGTIAENNYGAGVVILWESTSYEPLNGDPATAVKNGEIKFRALGTRMRGGWVLVRMKPRDAKEKRENWLLIKERDEFAEDDDSLATRFTTSIASGRGRDEIQSGAVAKTPAKRKPKLAAPRFREPQLCETAAEPPAGDGWLYEMKYDGYRLEIAIADGEATVYSRSGLDWSQRFPGLVAAARALPCKRALIDGEAVVFGENGVSDFPGLVEALERGRSERVEFVAFDLIERDGEDLAPLPLRKRKRALRKLIPDTGRLRYAEFLESDGAEMFRQAIAAGSEGIVAKRADSPYLGRRTSAWVKIKGVAHQDVVIIGHMPSTKGEAFASLLAARNEDGELTYVGRIGSGFAKWRKPIASLIAEQAGAAKLSALANAAKLPRGAVYWKRHAAAEVELAGWTGDGQMRHARLARLRDDLAPAARADAKPRKSSKAPPKPLVRITHAEREVFPDSHITKGAVAEYYARAYQRMAPHLENRIVSLLRAPDGLAGELFFQRHPLKGMAEGVVAVPDPGGKDSYFRLEGALGLSTAAQFGAIEIHGRMTRVDAPDRPDRVIFDLDPDPSVKFAAVRDAAVRIREALASAGLKSWPLLSGGKGVHVIAPLERANTIAEVEAFARGLAQGLAREKPDAFVATMSKSRRRGRIFIDWMRNQRAATAILPWSLRARPLAPVAVPVGWAELDGVAAANAFSIDSALDRDDPWAGEFYAVRQKIAASVLEWLEKAYGRK